MPGRWSGCQPGGWSCTPQVRDVFQQQFKCLPWCSGILCRWAGTHGPTDALSAAQLRPADAAIASTAGADAAHETPASASRPGTAPAERAGEAGVQAASVAAEEVVAGTLAARTGTLDAAAATASGVTAATPRQLEPFASPGPSPAAAPAAVPIGAADAPPKRGRLASGAIDGAVEGTCNGGPGTSSEPRPGAACRTAEGAGAGLCLDVGSRPGSGPAALAQRAPDGTIPTGVVALPVPDSTAAPLNQLHKDVQARVWPE